jgi:hypothetical protein
MNESEISNRASQLRRQAICRLNGIQFEKSAVAEPISSRAVPETKNEFWIRPKTDFWRLIPSLGAILVMFNGYSLYVGEMQRDYLHVATKDRCISGVTIQSSGGKHPAPYFKDSEGKKIASCFDFQCTYKNWRADLGKAANICLSGDVVVSIETEGELRITRDGLIDALNTRIWGWEAMLGLGLLCLAIFTYRERGKWKALWQTRFAKH